MENQFLKQRLINLNKTKQNLSNSDQDRHTSGSVLESSVKGSYKGENSENKDHKR